MNRSSSFILRKTSFFAIAMIFMITLSLWVGTESLVFGASAAKKVTSDVLVSPVEEQVSWIVKWKENPNQEFIFDSFIVKEYPEQHLVVARPASGVALEPWLEKWSQSDRVQYMQVNGTVTLGEASNDPFLPQQQYLDVIGMKDGWDLVTGNTRDIIAIVDTGIDLEHNELKDQLLPGMNLLNPKNPPQDDHGHGTNVAGVIAALGNNNAGIAGILWESKIMPIKTMYANGTGSEAVLGEGIRYAVDNGAKIVVLSLGLNKYTPYMSEVVQYAEDHGVLLVAAAGNEGNVVRYPAAYPTVLAVGGVNVDKSVHRLSNYGLELDLVAPMRVFTTKLGSDYEYKEGTSMAAPQVAAVAALIWAKYPDLQPYEVRNLLRQTAEKLESEHWNPETGYGLLRADRALSAEYRPDLHKPNHTMEQATPLPPGKMATAKIESATDASWFTIDAPYHGTLSVQLDKLNDSGGTLRVNVYRADGQEITAADGNLDSGNYRFNIEQGINYVRVSTTGLLAADGIEYSILPMLEIYKDSFEDNDHQYTAHKLPLRDQTIKGTFHKESDQDWYVITVNKAGLLRVSVSVDTARIDPVLLIQKKYEEPGRINNNEDGESEISPVMEVLPGEYYIRVSNVEDYMYPVLGEYTLQIEYTEKLVDPNEPNDRASQATTIGPNIRYSGVVDGRQDTDWFRFRLNEEQLVELTVDGITSGHYIRLLLADSRLTDLDEIINDMNEVSMEYRNILAPGDYYVKITGAGTFLQTKYEMQFLAEPVAAGFTDIVDHWAAKDIMPLVEDHIVEGYGDYTFRPDGLITRAEAVQLISNAFRLAVPQRQIQYIDVGRDHWGYDAISRAAANGIVNGYPDGSFGPDRRLTREEMVVILSRVLRLTEIQDNSAPFPDVEGDRWSAGWIRQMKMNGLVTGYGDGTFHPSAPATRAEFVALLSRVLK